MTRAAAPQVVVTESDVRRIWGAVRFVEATSARCIEGVLEVSAPGVRWLRNRSHLHVLVQIDQPAARRAEFAAHESAFDLAPVVAALNLSATVRDPLGRFLPRAFDIDLPRPAVPAGSTAPRFTPLDVVLDVAPATPPLLTWAVLRVSLRHNGQPAQQAVLRLQRPGGGALLGRGMSDHRGEALVVASGIAQVSVGDGALVVQREIAAELVISFDPAANLDEPINPDMLALRAGVVRITLSRTLASGRSEALTIDLP